MATVQGPELSGNNDSTETGNVMKIREILFGSQMRDYERRILSLEDRFSAETRSLREDISKRIDAIETYCNEEIATQQQRLRVEKGERTETIEELTREMQNIQKMIEKRLDQMAEESSNTQRDFRARLLEQSKALSGDIEAIRHDFLSTLDRTIHTLREEKTDRAQLGDFFTELGMRLKGEFDLAEEISTPSNAHQKELTR